MNETNWVPGLIVLSVGVVAGAIAALRFRGTPTAPTRTASGRVRATTKVEDLVHRDLVAKRDAQLAQLRELEDTGSKLPPAELARTRFELELATATTLRDLERHLSAHGGTHAAAGAASSGASAGPASVGEAAAAATVAADAAPAKGGAVWGAVIGVVLTSFVFALIWYAQSDATTRADGMPLTGGPQGSAPMGAPAAGGKHPSDDAELDPELAKKLDAEIAELQQYVAQNPDSVEAKNDLASAYLQRQKLMEAFGVAKEVLAVEPENPRALTTTAVVRLAMGQTEQAGQMLEKAVARDPSLPEAWVYRGLVAYDQQRFDVAVQSWERALELRPDGRAVIAPALEAAKARLAGDDVPAGFGQTAPRGPAPGGPMAGGPMAGGPTPGGPMAGGPPAGGPPAAAGPGISGVLSLAPGVSAPPGAIVFVSVRYAGVTAGPPVAAKRLPATSFPLSFSLGPQDAMMGQPFPPSGYLEARLDPDGNAMTKEPGSPTARLDAVAAGTSGLALTLTP